MTDWTPSTDPASGWTPDAPTKLDRGVLELEADFEGAGAQMTGLSTTLRPDALSFDYQTAYTMGPVAIGDASLGVLNRTWQMRYHDGGYYSARSNDANDAWEAETLLFADAGVPREIDVAFDQQGRIFVCAEIAGHVWGYFFDSTISAYHFVNFGDGVTPRCVLDSPFDTTISDVLVFYMNRTRGTLSFRQQRDRYLVEYDSPIMDGPGNTYIEDAARLSGYRVAVLHSVHDPIHGTYELRELESGLYPVPMTVDQFALGLSSESGTLIVVLFDEAMDAEQFQMGLASMSGILADAIIFHTLFDLDQFKMGLAAQSGTLLSAIILHTLFDIDQFKMAVTPQSGTMAVVVIEHTLFDLDQFKMGLSPLSGTLV